MMRNIIHSIPKRFVLVAVLLSMASVSSAGLSVDQPLSIPAMTRQAQVVVIGEVVSAAGEWNPARTLIVTRVEVSVGEILKGTVQGRRLSFFQLGGQVGDVASAVGGTPSFGRGERVLLFLSRRRDGTLGVVSVFQGKFSLERDPATGREMAVRSAPESAEVLDRLPVDEARSRILSALGR